MLYASSLITILANHLIIIVLIVINIIFHHHSHFPSSARFASGRLQLIRGMSQLDYEIGILVKCQVSTIPGTSALVPNKNVVCCCLLPNITPTTLPVDGSARKTGDKTSRIGDIGSRTHQDSDVYDWVLVTNGCEWTYPLPLYLASLFFIIYFVDK